MANCFGELAADRKLPRSVCTTFVRFKSILVYPSFVALYNAFFSPDDNYLAEAPCH